MSSKVTGGIVTFNNQDTIQACIESVLQYTDSAAFDLWVYDNASTDRTKAIIKEHFPMVHLIEGDQNIGFGGGHNQIVKRVDSEFHAIINPDIVMTEGTLQAMAAYMAEHEDTVQLTTEIRNMDGSIQYLPKLDPNFKFVILSKFKPFKKYRSVYTREFDTFDKPEAVMSSTGCFSMVRVRTFKKIHGYDRRFFLYFEDADISRRLRREGQIIYHPGLFVYHAWKRDNTGSIVGIFRFLHSMCKYHLKWGFKHD